MFPWEEWERKTELQRQVVVENHEVEGSLRTRKEESVVGDRMELGVLGKRSAIRAWRCGEAAWLPADGAKVEMAG